MTTTTPTPTGSPAASGGRIGRVASGLLEALLTQRVALLAALIIILLIVMAVLDGSGFTSGRYNADYLAGALISAVPLALLGLAELIVITSGRGGIDLSVGSIVSLAGIAFGFAYAQWEWPLLGAMLFAIAIGGLCGLLNGVLIAYVGFPALISTLATYYAFRSLALVVSGQKPISGPVIQDFYSAARSYELPVIGATLPLVPLGVFTFLIPVAIVIWLLLNKTTFGRRLYAIGTNDVAAQWAGVDVRRTRMSAYLMSGLIAGLVAVYTVAQFASARPDAGTSGNGMALPAITIAVLGGVAITGGIGRVGGVVLATLLIVWLNAGILLLFRGNDGAQFQLLALGVVLIGSSLLNRVVIRRRPGGIR